jgi:hypothetical protein
MKYKGVFELAHDQQLRGWVFCPAAPASRHELLARCGDEALGGATAELFRQDLADSEIGDGCHGFVINLTRPLSADEIAEVKVFVVSEGRELFQVPRPKARPPKQPAQEKPSRSLKLPLPPVDMSQHPVFVLGAARSGTSGVAQALLRSGWYEGEKEGFAIQALWTLIDATHAYYDTRKRDVASATMIHDVPKTHIIGGLRGLFAHLGRELYPSGRWIDKTPTSDMIRLAPILKEIFPNGKFIFMRRRAIENILSRQRKFPEVSLATHCADWAQVMSAWLEVRDRLGAAAIEMDQLAAAAQPDKTSATLIDFLGLPKINGRRFAEALKFDRPETTSDAFASVHDLLSLDWTMADKGTLLSVCGDLMREYGYSLDRTYFLADKAA